MRRSISPHLSSDAVGPEQLAAVAQRVAILNRRLTAVEKQVAGGIGAFARLFRALPAFATAGSRLDVVVPVADSDGWERKASYARRKGVSAKTVDRDVARGRLESRKEEGTRRCYVREVAS
jgi:hypothetical protein